MTYDVRGRRDNQWRIAGDFKLFDQRPSPGNIFYIFLPSFFFFGGGEGGGGGGSENRRAVEKSLNNVSLINLAPFQIILLFLSLAKRPSGAGSDERRLYSQANSS